MKQSLTTLFWPLLKLFETGQEPANYKSSHRTALNVLGLLFIFLSVVSAISGIFAEGGISGLIPVLVFFSVGLVAVVVGTLGSNKAVAKIWGTK